MGRIADKNLIIDQAKKQKQQKTNQKEDNLRRKIIRSHTPNDRQTKNGNNQNKK